MTTQASHILSTPCIVRYVAHFYLIIYGKVQYNRSDLIVSKQKQLASSVKYYVSDCIPGFSVVTNKNCAKRWLVKMDDDIEEQWRELSEDYKKLEEAHQLYLEKLKELTAQQNICLSQINHQRYLLNAINRDLKQTKDVEKLKCIKEEFIKREAQLQIIEETLPREGGLYLKIILGNINVGFLSQEAKFKYKEGYETFKLVCVIFAFILVILNIFVSSRFLQKAYLFFLVWYYCTVTIRECVLRANGSKIKPWWRIHHALSVLAAIVILLWPKNRAWGEFKGQFFRYNLYTCLVQYLQFNYQRGALYRLKTLGKKGDMELTIEGFQYWMWRGLAFLYPFLFAAYIYQLANAWALYKMYVNHPESSWHILASCLFMLTFFLGNSITTLLVIPTKIKNRMLVRYKIMTGKLYNAVSIPNSTWNKQEEKSS